jgi:hypothetical protein
MKSLIFSLFSLLSLTALQAQNYSYSPFPKQIGVWHFTEYNEFGTIIGGRNYQYVLDSTSGVMIGAEAYFEDNKRIFLVTNTDTVLIYDFRLTIGDTIIGNTPFGVDTFYVFADDSTGYYGRRHLTLLPISNSFLTTEWVEGIGKIGGTWGMWQAFTTGSLSGGLGFWCMYGDSASIPCNSALNDLENTLNEFTVFPNPNSGSFTLKTEQPGPCTVTIYNSAGQVVYTSELHGASANRIDLPLAPAGLYILEYADGKSVLREKLIIQHY